MKKGQKIKRYGNIYDRKNGLRTALMGIAAVAVILLLALLGWILYEPVRDFILSDPSAAPRPSSSQSAPVEPSSQPIQNEAPSEASGSPEAQPTEPGGAVRGIFITADTAASPAAMEALLGSASASGVNTVLVEGKDAAGIVRFDTANATAMEAKAVSDTVYSASRTASLIREKGLLPAARLCAFRDATTSAAVKKLAVTYGNSTTRWLDNSAAQGGKSWLNPCSEEAQQYIIDLALELTKAGFDTIVLDAVQFPSGVGLDKAGFGMSANFSRQEALQGFLAKITSAVEQAGGHVLVSIPGENIESEAENKALTRSNGSIYGGSPEQLAGARALLLLPAGEKGADAYALARSKAPTVEWLLSVPVFTSDGAAASVNEALAQLGISEGYFLYNPEGTYLFR